jgi:hypothetical protein
MSREDYSRPAATCDVARRHIMLASQLIRNPVKFLPAGSVNGHVQARHRVFQICQISVIMPASLLTSL